MDCKWFSDGFETCTNGDCPYCADFCPVAENQEVCRYSGLDDTETVLRRCLDTEKEDSREAIQALAEENRELKKQLAAYEDILGDDYDLDRLAAIMNQRMSMREDVAERWKLTSDIPLDRLRELAQADREGRCVVLPAGGFGDQDGKNALKSAMNTCYYHNNPVTRFIADAVAEKLLRDEAVLKERENNE